MTDDIQNSAVELQRALIKRDGDAFASAFAQCVIDFNLRVGEEAFRLVDEAIKKVRMQGNGHHS